MKMKAKRCVMCGVAAAPAENLCPRHIISQNHLRYQFGYMREWINLELELWPLGIEP